MQTSNQAIRNLGRHARHVATIGFTSLGLAAVLSSSALAQTHHSGERSDDFTMMPRNMTPLSIEQCASNQIAVGSTCVDVSSGATTGVRSWVSYFLGQSRRFRNEVVTISLDGTQRLTFLHWGGYVENTDIPYGDSPAFFGSRGGTCASTPYIYPTRDRLTLLNGGAPTGFELGEERTDGCAD